MSAERQRENLEAGTKVYTSQAVILLENVRDKQGAHVELKSSRAFAFHPVYETYEDFKADWPDDEPLETTITDNIPVWKVLQDREQGG